MIVYIKTGKCLSRLQGRDLKLGEGDFADCEKSFATRPSQLELDTHAYLLQPRLDLSGSVSSRFYAPQGAWPNLKAIFEMWSDGIRLSCLRSQMELGVLVLVFDARIQTNFYRANGGARLLPLGF